MQSAPAKKRADKPYTSQTINRRVYILRIPCNNRHFHGKLGILPELRNTLSQFVLPTPNATDDVPMQACLPHPARARSATRSTCGALSRMLPIELIQVRDGAHSLLSIMLRVRHLRGLDCERQAGAG